MCACHLQVTFCGHVHVHVCTFRWGKVTTELQAMHTHLLLMASEFLVGLATSDDVKEQTYHRLFDLTKSDDEKVVSFN